MADLGSSQSVSHGNLCYTTHPWACMFNGASEVAVAGSSVLALLTAVFYQRSCSVPDIEGLCASSHNQPGTVLEDLGAQAFG